MSVWGWVTIVVSNLSQEFVTSLGGTTCSVSFLAVVDSESESQPLRTSMSSRRTNMAVRQFAHFRKLLFEKWMLLSV